MPRAKTQTQTKAKKPTTEEIIKQQVQEQLQEALLNIEFSAPEQTDAWVDMDLLREEIKKEVEFELKKQEHVEETQAKADASLSRSELKLIGTKEYNITSDLDGLVISEKDKALFTASKSGAIGFGLKAPRSFGVGSAHFRACLLYTSPSPRDRQKARMPSSA